MAALVSGDNLIHPVQNEVEDFLQFGQGFIVEIRAERILPVLPEDAKLQQLLSQGLYVLIQKWKVTKLGIEVPC